MIPTWPPVQRKYVSVNVNMAQIRFRDDTPGQNRCPEIWFQIRTGPISHEAINQTRAACFVGRVAPHFICLPNSEDGRKRRWRRESGGGTEKWRSDGSLQAQMRSLYQEWAIFIISLSTEKKTIWTKSCSVKEGVNTRLLNCNQLVRSFDVRLVFLCDQ